MLTPAQFNTSCSFISNCAWLVSSLFGQPNGKGFSGIVEKITMAFGFEA